MRRAILAVMLCAVVLSAVEGQADAQQPAWYPTAVACTKWAEANICRGKNACPSWIWVAQCLVTQKSLPAKVAPAVKARLDWCTDTIEYQREQQRLARTQGNPLGATIDCLNGSSPRAG